MAGRRDGFVITGDDRRSAHPFMRVGSSVVANIYSEPCLDKLLDPPLGPTVDDLATAFADAWGTNATTPTEVTLDGFIGMQMVLTVPADVALPIASPSATWPGGTPAAVTAGTKDPARSRSHGSSMSKGNGC